MPSFSYSATLETMNLPIKNRVEKGALLEQIIPILHDRSDLYETFNLEGEVRGEYSWLLTISLRLLPGSGIDELLPILYCETKRCESKMGELAQIELF